MMSVLSTQQPSATPDGVAREQPLYEVVDGQKVELPPLSIYAARIASKLQTRLEVHAEAHGLGLAVTEALFILDSVRDLRRRPDVAFVSAAKWPLDRPLPEAGDWEMAPSATSRHSCPSPVFLHDWR
jgi:hypothetical protein